MGRGDKSEAFPSVSFSFPSLPIRALRSFPSSLSRVSRLPREFPNPHSLYSNKYYFRTQSDSIELTLYWFLKRLSRLRHSAEKRLQKYTLQWVLLQEAKVVN